jgi:hypothetical protein
MQRKKPKNLEISWNLLNNCYWEYDFFMANDLLEDNGCLVVLQGIDDAFAMEFFFFCKGW